MAGEWLKIRTRLHEEPEVLRIAAATHLEPFAVAGRLTAFWGWAGEKTTDGALRAVTPFVIDNFLSCEGFCEAMRDAGWIEISELGDIRIPNWKKHNANSRKQRELAARRQARYRAKKQRDVTRNVTQDSNACRASRREEKRREESPNGDSKKESPDGRLSLSRQVEELYRAYPRKVKPKDAKAAIAKALQKVPFDDLMLAVSEFAASPKGKGDYCPYPATWFNAEEWSDDRSEWYRDGRPGAAGGNRGSSGAPNLLEREQRREQQQLDILAAYVQGEGG